MEKVPGVQFRQSSVSVMNASKYTQLEQAVQEIRPYTLQILRTPYFHSCKAARSIRQVLREMGELCKQMRAETVLLAKQKRPSEGGTCATGVLGDDSNKRSKYEAATTVEHTLPPHVSVSKAQEKVEVTSPQESGLAGSRVEMNPSPRPGLSNLEEKAETSPGQGNRLLYPIVGGSPAGMNFIMFPAPPKKDGTSAS